MKHVLNIRHSALCGHWEVEIFNRDTRKRHVWIFDDLNTQQDDAYKCAFHIIRAFEIAGVKLDSSQVIASQHDVGVL